MPNFPKLLIISDTHGNAHAIERIIKKHHNDHQHVFHCGDSELSSHDPVLKNIHIVRGNCDYDANLPNERLIEIEQTRIYITHGHLYGVKSSLTRLHEKAQSMNANVVLYGHSHIANAEIMDDILYVNPGSIAYPRGSKNPTYCIITLSESPQVDFYIYDSSGS